MFDMANNVLSPIEIIIYETFIFTPFAGFNCFCRLCAILLPVIQYGNQYAYIDAVQLGTINNITGLNAAAPNSYYSCTSARRLTKKQIRRKALRKPSP